MQAHNIFFTIQFVFIVSLVGVHRFNFSLVCTVGRLSTHLRDKLFHIALILNFSLSSLPPQFSPSSYVCISRLYKHSNTVTAVFLGTFIRFIICMCVSVWLFVSIFMWRLSLPLCLVDFSLFLSFFFTSIHSLILVNVCVCVCVCTLTICLRLFAFFVRLHLKKRIYDFLFDLRCANFVS